MRPRQNWFRGRSALGDETTFDQEVLTDGIRLSLIGMGVVFAVLSILALAIKAFDRIDSIIPEQGSAEPKTASATAVAPTTETTQQPDSASDDVLTAAAIGVALALAEIEGPTSPVSSRTARSATNTWVAAGRGREMSNRTASQPMRTRTGR